MGAYAEVIILYAVLFLPGSALMFINGAGGTLEFSVAAELNRIFLYSIPSLALIWYMLHKSKREAYYSILQGKNDLISGIIAFPVLFITGSLFAAISSYTGESPAQVLYSPSGAAEWITLCFSLLFAAYLEESFFRFYILSKRDELKLGALPALALSTALFSICHLYEGIWGFFNSAVSGTLLGFIFLRYNSLHGIAFAHAVYNILAYCLIAG